MTFRYIFYLRGRLASKKKHCSVMPRRPLSRFSCLVTRSESPGTFPPSSYPFPFPLPSLPNLWMVNCDYSYDEIEKKH